MFVLVSIFASAAILSRLADGFSHSGFLVRMASRSSFTMAASSDEFSALTKKLMDKKEQAAVATTSPKKEVVTSKAQTPKPVVTAKPVVSAPTVTAPVVNKVEPVKVVAAPVEKVQKVIEVPSTPPTTALSAPEAFLGIGLGLAPYLAIPFILFNAVKGLLKKPKPLPVVEVQKPKVVPYTKSLGEGLKEGIDELLSGKSTEDLDLTRKGIKLSVGGFSVAALFTGLLLVLNGGNTETKEVPKATPSVAQTKAPAPAPVPVVKAPAPAPVPVVKPTPVPVPVVVPVPAPVPVVIPAPVVVPPPAPVVVPAPVPVVVPVPAPVPAPVPVVVPVPAPVVTAPAPVVVPVPASAAVEEIYVPVIPKGMEADKVDLSALKSLRKSRK